MATSSDVVSMNATIGDVCTNCWSVPCRCNTPSYPYGSYFFTTNWMPTCQHCGGQQHEKIEECPQVKEVLYFKDGSIRKLTFHGR